jgi:hypothetical protein
LLTFPSPQVCALINLAIIPFTDGWAPFEALMTVGPSIFLSNAMVAFLLNVAAVFLIGVGSGLVLTLAGVFKVISIASVYEAHVHRSNCFAAGYSLDYGFGADLLAHHHTDADFRFVYNRLCLHCAS